jgi:hypothetical protein
VSDYWKDFRDAGQVTKAERRDRCKHQRYRAGRCADCGAPKPKAPPARRTRRHAADPRCRYGAAVCTHAQCQGARFLGPCQGCGGISGCVCND